MNGRSFDASGHHTLGLILDAIDVVLTRLEMLSPSPDVVALRAAALRQLGEVQRWERTSPPLEEQEQLMRRVLGLHIGTARLERATRKVPGRSRRSSPPS
jgi:hypothetical protein